MELVTEVYRVSGDSPRRETYGLSSQLRSSPLSVPSNIAEGKGRESKKEFVVFLYRARGSLLEAETQIEVAKNLEYISQELFEEMLERCAGVGRVLNGLIKAIKRQIATPPPKSPQPRANS
jgi:four helix bundle protein